MSISRRNVWSGVLFGIGFVAFFDEAVFHQLLRWHHFYDLSTTDIGLISDGLFHAFSWFGTIAGLFLFHMMENIGMTMGLLPITGVPLLFVSYGGSSMIISFICLGLLLNISGKRQKTIFIK